MYTTAQKDSAIADAQFIFVSVLGFAISANTSECVQWTTKAKQNTGMPLSTERFCRKLETT